MNCTRPNFISGKGFVQCGKCPNCIINKKKEWADRLMIESTYWPYKYFVTLTYDPEHMPDDLCVNKSHIVKWKKRLGYYCNGIVPQHYYCAEYGDHGGLPHYHACIFSDVDLFEAIRNSWDKGRVGIDHLTAGRCKYVAGYVTKKLDKNFGEGREDGRTPEFYGASRKPALGYRLLYDILERFVTDDVFRERMLRHVYPPYSVRIAGKYVRLPPYIRTKLTPLWKLYNEQKQKDFARQKAQESYAILKQIAKNLQDLCLLDDQSYLRNSRIVALNVAEASHDIRMSLEDRIRKAYGIRHRRN